MTKAERRKAIVLPITTYHVPPKVLSKAVFIMFSLPSIKDSPHTPLILDPIKKIKQTNKFIIDAKIETSVAAFGPKCFVKMSLIKNANQEMIVPQSKANHAKEMFKDLFANRFMVIIVITNKDRTIGGIFLIRSLNS